MKLSIVKRTSEGSRHARRAFTLTELLVTVAIIGILSALLLTAVSRGKNSAGKATDLNNLRQIVMAVHIYSPDYADVLPLPNWDDGNGELAGWLYKPGSVAKDRFRVQTGLLWP